MLPVTRYNVNRLATPIIAFSNRIHVEGHSPVLMLWVHPAQPALKEHPLLATGGMAL